MAASIYDATYVLARALDNVIKNNGSIYDGVQVYNSMKGRPYRSKFTKAYFVEVNCVDQFLEIMCHCKFNIYIA